MATRDDQPRTMYRESIFDRIVDERRCTAASAGNRRCQLYRDHRQPHASAWREQGTGRRVRRKPLPLMHVLRWDESGEWPDDDNDERLPWCALLSPH